MMLFKVREDLRRWACREGWPLDQISTAIAVTGRWRNIIRGEALKSFLKGEDNLTEEEAGQIVFFMERYPAPTRYGDFYHWYGVHNKQGVTGSKVREADILRRREATEAARREYEARHLAAERKPQRSRFPAGIRQPLSDILAVKEARNG